MRNLELSIQREIDFMIKYRLTADELFLVRMILYAQDGHKEFLKSYFALCNLGKTKIELFESLKNKGIIKQSFKIPEAGTKFNPNDVDFEADFIKSYMAHAGTLGMELWEAYPKEIWIQNKRYSLTNISRVYDKLEDFCFAYASIIKNSPKRHAEVMELLEYGKDNNLINNNICDFVIGRQWEALEQYRDGDVGIFKTTELV